MKKKTFEYQGADVPIERSSAKHLKGINEENQNREHKQELSIQ